MIKLLFITYWYPPVNAIGAVRAAKFVKFLPEFGIEPVVLTSRYGTLTSPNFLGLRVPDGAKICRTPTFDAAEAIKNLSRRLMGDHPQGFPRPQRTAGFARRIASSLYYNLLDVPDPQLGWFVLSRRHALKFSQREKPHVVMSSSFPASAHLLAAYVKRNTGLPWIAEYRDLWTNNTFLYKKCRLMHRIDRSLELKALKDVDRVVTVSEPLARRLTEYLHKETSVILNGFDSDDYQGEIERFETFTLTYTGSIYEGKRDPSPLFLALREMLDSGEFKKGEIEVHFYGRKFDNLDDLVSKYRLSETVKKKGFVDYERSLSIQRGSSALLMLDWLGQDGILSGKIFEYLGSMRPILCIGESPGNVLGRLLHTTGAGDYCRTNPEIKEVLRGYMRSFRTSGSVPYAGNISKVIEYTRREAARKLSGIILSLVRPRRS